MTPFQEAWRKLHGIEGDYADNPNDSGGKTRFGVTEAVARKWGYQGDMRNLPLRTAGAIAKVEYWDVMRLDDVAQIAGWAVAYELFDSCYNVGQERAAVWLQEALTVLNLAEKIYPDLLIDGRIGDLTLRALNRYCVYRRPGGETILLKALNCRQGSFYIDLALRREKDEEFIYGWLRQRVVL